MPARPSPLIPLSLALGSLGLSACATTPAPTPAPPPPPQIALSDSLRDSPCLRGTLPAEDGLTVGAALAFGTERHRDALCERSWGQSLVGAIEAANEALRGSHGEAR